MMSRESLYTTQKPVRPCVAWDCNPLPGRQQTNGRDQQTNSKTHLQPEMMEVCFGASNWTCKNPYATETSIYLFLLYIYYHTAGEQKRRPWVIYSPRSLFKQHSHWKLVLGLFVGVRRLENFMSRLLWPKNYNTRYYCDNFNPPKFIF